MNVNHIVRMKNQDALTTLRRFIAAWWTQAGVDAMLAPAEMPDHSEVSPRVIESVDQVDTINPFAPVMLTNMAGMVDDFVYQNPGKTLAVMLRPCELRTIVEMQKRHRAPAYAQASNQAEHKLIMIGVDCPGTYAAGDYSHLVAQKGAEYWMAQNLLHGSTNTLLGDQDFRLACQLCDQTLPLGADLTIGAIGVAPAGFLLFIAHDEQWDKRLKLQHVTDGIATEEEVVLREEIAGGIEDHRQARQKELFQPASLDEEFCSMLGIFARCSLCADCLDACPLYNGELAGMLGVRKSQEGGQALLPEVVKLSRWLASCSGCGMCEEACSQHVSMGRIVSNISFRIRSELHYNAGDAQQRLPWDVD